MKYQSHPRFHYSCKKHTPRKKRRVMQAILDQMYFKTDHAKIGSHIEKAMIEGTSALQVVWDDIQGTVVVE